MDEILTQLLLRYIKAASRKLLFKFRMTVQYVIFIFNIRKQNKICMKIIYAILILIVTGNCTSKNKCAGEPLKINQVWLDSIKKSSDTVYTRKYRNGEFVTSEYYVNKIDSSVCQVMKDSSSRVRQIIIAKKNQRIFTAEYYPNGQLKASLPLDSLGKYDGTGKYYFDDGCIKSQGVFRHGLYSGRWKTYNNRGELISTDDYDTNGQLIKSTTL